MEMLPQPGRKSLMLNYQNITTRNGFVVVGHNSHSHVADERTESTSKTVFLNMDEDRGTYRIDRLFYGVCFHIEMASATISWYKHLP